VSEYPYPCRRDDLHSGDIPSPPQEKGKYLAVRLLSPSSVRHLSWRPVVLEAALLSLALVVPSVLHSMKNFRNTHILLILGASALALTPVWRKLWQEGIDRHGDRIELEREPLYPGDVVRAYVQFRLSWFHLGYEILLRREVASRARDKPASRTGTRHMFVAKTDVEVSLYREDDVEKVKQSSSEVRLQLTVRVPPEAEPTFWASHVRDTWFLVKRSRLRRSVVGDTKYALRVLPRNPAQSISEGKPAGDVP
jgi:hypothetical protein